MESDVRRFVFKFKDEHPVEFCIISGKLYVFYADVSWRRNESLQQALVLPANSYSQCVLMFGKENTTRYTLPGRGSHRKYRPSEGRPTPLVTVLALRARLVGSWQNKQGAADLVKFLDHVLVRVQAGGFAADKAKQPKQSLLTDIPKQGKCIDTESSNHWKNKYHTATEVITDQVYTINSQVKQIGDLQAENAALKAKKKSFLARLIGR